MNKLSSKKEIKTVKYCYTVGMPFNLIYICSKSTIETQKTRHACVFIVNVLCYCSIVIYFEHAFVSSVTGLFTFLTNKQFIFSVYFVIVFFIISYSGTL